MDTHQRFCCDVPESRPEAIRVTVFDDIQLAAVADVANAGGSDPLRLECLE